MFVFVINRFSFIKYCTCMKESGITYIVNVLIGRSRPCGKGLHSCVEFLELRVEGAVPLAEIVLSYHLFKTSRTYGCKRTLKISTELSKTHK